MSEHCVEKNFKKFLKRVMYSSLVLISILLFSCSHKNYGVFEHSSDVGPVSHAGTTSFDKETNTYQLSGAGANIWFAKDEFHYAYNKISGDFLLKARGELLGEGVDPHRKIGWMLRSSLDTSATMICVTVHGDGLTSIQYRKNVGEDVEEIKSPIIMPDVFQIEKRGNTITANVGKQGEELWTGEVVDLKFPEEMFAGLFICSHNADVVEHAKFWDVQIMRYQ